MTREPSAGDTYGAPEDEHAGDDFENSKSPFASGMKYRNDGKRGADQKPQGRMPPNRNSDPIGSYTSPKKFGVQSGFDKSKAKPGGR